MHEPLITVVGNVAGPPALRVTATGVTVADFRVAATPRRLDRASDAWADGETIWFGVTAWRSLGEHCAASLKKGDRVVVTGKLTNKSWEMTTGEKRTGLEIDAASVGLDLSRGTAAYQRTPSLVSDQEAWVSSGNVDGLTGEVLRETPDEDGEQDPERLRASDQAAAA